MQKTFVFISFLISFHMALSQGHVEELDDSTFHQVVDALLFVNYGEENANRPQKSLFYYSDIGEFIIKTHHSWTFSNDTTIILNEIKRFSACKLIEETKFNHLDLNWLKSRIQRNSKSSQVNFIFYDHENNLGYIRAYQLFLKE